MVIKMLFVWLGLAHGFKLLRLWLQAVRVLIPSFKKKFKAYRPQFYFIHVVWNFISFFSNLIYAFLKDSKKRE